jgi:16S rRNA (uracil1498-N3)-methyltransferase
MTRRRFYVPRDFIIEDETAHLPPDQAHHLRDVLRIGTGEVVEIFDGEGAGYTGEVLSLDSGVAVHRLKKLPSEQSWIPVILATALTRPAKFEWMLEKATELGVHEIIPIITRRSDIRIPRDKAEARCERWNRIVREASKQCGRLSALRVRPPLNYADMLRCEEFSGSAKTLFYENAREFWRPDCRTLSRGVVLCVGPAGGWDRSEIEEARRAGFGVFSLGMLVLRAETAAIAAVSIAQYHVNLQRSGERDGGNLPG